MFISYIPAMSRAVFKVIRYAISFICQSIVVTYMNRFTYS